MEQEKQVFIIAPHADDEVIGCYSVLINHKPNTPDITVLFPDIKTMDEALNSSRHFGFDCELIIDALYKVTGHGHTFYFPDPHFELHPLHRELGIQGEVLARKGENVIFYSTNMNTPYIGELRDPTRKRHWLNKIYEQKKSLWEYEHKYFIFEGYCKWMF